MEVSLPILTGRNGNGAMSSTWKICLYLADYRSRDLSFYAIVYRNVNIEELLVLKRLKTIKLLIKFLCGNNATCRTCTITSNLSFSGEIVVRENLQTIPEAHECGFCQSECRIVVNSAV